MERALSPEENDQLARSTKKVKRTDGGLRCEDGPEAMDTGSPTAHGTDGPAQGETSHERGLSY